ncbi:MAG: hypothetical protein JNM31_04895 [Flavobacteriales bacterium]|nr:hypothetical protein [Flavobacteriales bacterium]
MLLLLASCGAGREAFRGDGFQKRVHRAGWSLGGRAPVQQRDPRHAPDAAVLDARGVDPGLLATVPANEIRSGRTTYRIPSTAHRAPEVHANTAPGQAVVAIANTWATPLAANAHAVHAPVDKPRGVFNWLAPIALLIAIGVPLAGILLQSSALAIGGAAAGFILGLIASRTCRDKGKTGSGFAMAALILSSLLLVLTAIGLAQGGG